MGITGTGFFIAFCFLVVGCFLDAIPAIIIVGTILEPLARAVHMDPVHFAMIGIISLAFGLVTPPYGLCLMISCAIAKVRLMYVHEGRHDHARADAVRAVGDDRLAGHHPDPAEAHLAGIHEVGASEAGEAKGRRPRRLASATRRCAKVSYPGRFKRRARGRLHL